MNKHAEPCQTPVRAATGLPQGWRSTAFALLVGALSAASAPVVRAADTEPLLADLDKTRTEISVVEGRVKGLESRLEELRTRLREERDQSYRNMHSAKREITRQQFETVRIRQSIDLIDQQIVLIKTDTDRTIERYESLNPLKRSLEASAHAARLQENSQRIGVLERDKQPLQEQLAKAESKLAQLRSTLPGDAESEVSVDDDPQIVALLNQRTTDNQRLVTLRQQMAAQRTLLAAAEDQNRQADKKRQATIVAAAEKPVRAEPRKSGAALPVSIEPPAAGVPASSATWVFAISGDDEKNIESVLKLKSWVESYGGRYVQAHWNGFGESSRADTDQFRFEFAEKLRQIPPTSRVVIIGHGRGGGAAIEAATDVAYTLGRVVDFLAVLDPIGEGNLRANIVYNTDACKSPEGKGSNSIRDYLDCVTGSPRRTITSNVRFFYNRWQKEGHGPADFAPTYGVEDGNGDLREVPSATGRFTLAGNVASDQKRVFFDNDGNAHQTLLEQESRELPNLLVKYLR